MIPVSNQINVILLENKEKAENGVPNNTTKKNPSEKYQITSLVFDIFGALKMLVSN